MGCAWLCSFLMTWFKQCQAQQWETRASGKVSLHHRWAHEVLHLRHAQPPSHRTFHNAFHDEATKPHPAPFHLRASSSTSASETALRILFHMFCRRRGTKPGRASKPMHGIDVCGIVRVSCVLIWCEGTVIWA